MNLKDTIDKQIYLRNKEKLGQTNVPGGDVYTFADKTQSSQKYFVPISWSIISYVYNRQNQNILNNFSIDDFVDYSGDLSQNSVSYNSDNINFVMLPNLNFGLISSIYTETGFYAECNISSTKNLDFCAALFYDEVWHEVSFSGKQGKPTIYFPPNKKIILALCFYSQEGNNRISFSIGFNQLVGSWEAATFPMNTPKWAADIDTDINTVTSNITNSLYFIPPINKIVWDRTEIYRSDGQIEDTVQSELGFGIAPGGFYIPTTNQDEYPIGSVVQNNKKYNVQNAELVPGNLITNGGFSSLTGWTATHTGAAGGSFQVSKNNALFGDTCLEYTAPKTVATKTSFIQTTNYIAISTANIYNCMLHLKVSSAASLPSMRVIFYANNTGTLATGVSSSNIYFSQFSRSTIWANSNWNKVNVYFGNTENENIQFRIPTNAQYMKLRIYPVVGSTSQSIIQFDAAYLGISSSNQFYNNSTSAQQMIVVDDHFSYPSNNSTWGVFPLATSLAARSGSGALSASGTLKYRPKKFVNMYEGAAETRIATKNYINYGDFSNRAAFRVSSAIIFESTSDTMYGSTRARISGNAPSRVISTTIPTGSSISGYWNISFCAKRGESSYNQAIFTTITDSSAAIGNFKRFELSTSWNRYTYRIDLSSATSTRIKAYVYGEDMAPGDIYVSGLQLEKSYNPSYFLDDALTGSTISGSYFKVSTANSNTIFNAPYGSISFNVFMPYSSEGKPSGQDYLMTRYFNAASNWITYYDFSTKTFGFLRNGGGLITHSARFVPGQQIFVGLKWTPSKYYFYIDSAVGSVSKTAVNGNNAQLSFGHYVPIAQYQNLLIQNLRVDTAGWDDSHFANQSKSRDYGPLLSQSDITSYNWKLVGLVNKKINDTILYVDDNGLKNGQDYYYSLIHKGYGSFSDRSEIKHIIAGDTSAPNPVFNTSYESFENSIRYKWQRGSQKTHAYFVYSGPSKNLNNLTMGPKVIYSNGVATSSFTLDQIYDNYSRSIYVLPFDKWNNFHTSNAVQITGRANFGDTYKNLVPNPSFEYTNKYTSIPIGWTAFSPNSNGGILDNNYFFGSGGLTGTQGTSLRVGFSGAIYHYMYADCPIPVTFDSANPLKFVYSHWAHAGNVNPSTPSAVNIGFLDQYKKAVGSITLQMNVVQTQVGADGRTWWRYATSFSHVAGWASGKNPVAYFRVAPITYPPFLGDKSGLVDSLQLELASSNALISPFRPSKPSDYVASFISESGTLHGGQIEKGTIVPEHFPNSVLRIEGKESTGAGVKIVIGKEEINENYNILKPTAIRFHASGMSTNDGFNYARHVESGFSDYGGSVQFVNRYTDLYGNPITPHVIAVPKLIQTYSSANSTKNQSLSFTVEASAGGFLANAYLLQGDTVANSGGTTIGNMYVTTSGGVYVDVRNRLYSFGDVTGDID